MPFVQKIDFILSRTQIDELLKDANNDAIRLRLGVETNAMIVMRAIGIKRENPELMRLEEGKEDGLLVCPTPPGCK